MSVNTNWETCKNAKLNTTNNDEFSESKYIPSNFTISTHLNQKAANVDLTGKPAPDWILTDTNNNSVAFKNLKSRVLMIQFTGIGCPPCHASIPFLKKLVTEYDVKNFEFISIEAWSRNIDGVRRYQNKNDLKYKFLLSTDEIIKRYHVDLVPEFFIIDKKRIIRKVINGYEEGVTDKEIRDRIKELI